MKRPIKNLAAMALSALALFATTGAWAGSMKSFDYDPKEISIGDKITIEYETSKQLGGNITISLGDHEQVFQNYPAYGTVEYSYHGTQTGELEGVFQFTDQASETSTKTFQVTVNPAAAPAVATPVISVVTPRLQFFITFFKYPLAQTQDLVYYTHQ